MEEMHAPVVALADTARAVEFSVAGRTTPLAWRELFSGDAPIEVDLGCGDGSFLAAMAGQNPDRNFVGIERLVGRVRSACHKIGSRGLTNARVVRADIADAVQHLFPRGSVGAFHLLFPDPWPKRRHHRRRVVTAEFLRAVCAALAPHGWFHVATDQADYFDAIMTLVRQACTFDQVNETSSEPPFPSTTFEQRYRAAGDEIYRVVLRKASG